LELSDVVVCEVLSFLSLFEEDESYSPSLVVDSVSSEVELRSLESSLENLASTPLLSL
jgi:hypothetical protein